MSAVPDGLIQTWRETAYKIRGGPLTYRKFVSESRNHKLGTVTPTYTNSLIQLALIGVEGSVESSQITFRIPYSAMPEYPPDLRSRIVFRGFDWLIRSYKVDTARTQVTINCVRP
jgi:hypothetical protein